LKTPIDTIVPANPTLNITGPESISPFPLIPLGYSLIAETHNLEIEKYS